MNRIIIVLGVLIFAMALYVVNNNESTMSFNKHTDMHVLTVTTANEISSYAKRAEGHLLIYLMLKKPVDRNKFFERMDSLKEKISILAKFQVNDKNIKDTRELMQLHSRTLVIANKLFHKFDNTVTKNSTFNFKLNHNLITNFHNLTSNIRRNAVTLVKISATKIQNEKKTLITNLDSEKPIIFFIVIMCFALLSVIVLLSKKMNLISQKLHEYSYIDSLTGLANRRAFDETFDTEWQRALREKSNLALMLIDIDSFKQVNDLHGHSAGDICLAKIAKTLQSCLKRPTDIIARYGGEEFAIILPNTTEAILVAEQCRQSINEMAFPFDNLNNLSITIGLGVFNVSHKFDKTEVIEKVDQALYRGKSVGKNRVECATL